MEGPFLSTDEAAMPPPEAVLRPFSYGYVELVIDRDTGEMDVITVGDPAISMVAENDLLAAEVEYGR
ncbi:MAG TPA: hypothetical protein VGA08_00980 [Candidatus Saccharimonadales bacterium]